MCTFFRPFGVLFSTVLGVFFAAATASAMPHVVKQGIFTKDGAIRGGEAGKAFSLLEVRRIEDAKKGLERLVFEMGNERGEPIKTRPGYFQVRVDKATRRVILNFSQMAGTTLTEKKIMKALKRSPYVKSVKMTYDPEDHGLTLQLLLKRQVKVKVFELSPKTKGGRMALDLMGA